MKKILLSILGIFFCLSSFVSAEEYTFVGDYSDFIGFDTTFRIYTNSNKDFFNLSGFSVFCSACDIDFCNSQLNSIISSFSNIFSNISINHIGNYNDNEFCPGSIDNIVFNPYLIDNSGISLRFPSGVDYDGSLYSYSFVGFNNLQSIESLNFSSAGIPFHSFFGDFVSLDSFKIYYGNQSQEYELIEDIDIYINSPVIRNGNNFIYDGSTGINLVYNNSYNRYDKNKLYLDGLFRFSKGVFTPICLN